MRYIDRTGCKMHDKGKDHEIKSMGALTRKATAKAEAAGLAVMKTCWGPYKIIRQSGFGAGIMDSFETLEDVDKYIKKNI